MVTGRTISCFAMAFVAVALVITILVFWLMDKPFKFGQVEALNTDTRTAIDETAYFAKFTQAFREENKKLEENR